MGASSTRRPFFSSVLRTALAILVLCVLVPSVVLLGAVYVYSADARAEGRVYSGVSLGQTRSALEQAFGRPADYVCTFHDYTVLYFFTPGFNDEDYVTGGKGWSRMPSTVDSHESVPSIYGAKQFLLNKQREVIAYSWNGETTRIHSVDGEFPGSAISELPSTFFGESPD